MNDGVIEIVLADDQELFRAGLRVMLEAQTDMTVIGEAADGREALDLVGAVSPDVLLLDMRMPGMDGTETVRRLFDESSTQSLPRVIVLSTFDLDPAAATAIRHGASGFLLKGTSPAFLFSAVRAVHSGTAVIAPGDLTALFTEDILRVQPTQPAEYSGLSVRERAIFAWVARGLSNTEIAKREFVAESTVKTQLSSVLAKLGLRDRVQLVVYAHTHGLTGVSAPDDRGRRCL